MPSLHRFSLASPAIDNEAQQSSQENLQRGDVDRRRDNKQRSLDNIMWLARTQKPIGDSPSEKTRGSDHARQKQRQPQRPGSGKG